jgi:hypothetical protein
MFKLIGIITLPTGSRFCGQTQNGRWLRAETSAA